MKKTIVVINEEKELDEMDRLEALKILKENSSTMAIPVAMLTSRDEDIYKLRKKR